MYNLEFIIVIVNAVLLVIMFGIFSVWLYFLGYMIKSFKQSPSLKCFNKLPLKKFPKISVILPARNEEKYIAKCLDSLLKQDYPDFEIIVINDSSTDRTSDIIQEYAMNHKFIRALNADPKPEGWVGKNWACYQAYLEASGDLLLFTDADTVHQPSTMSLATEHLLQENLDAITLIPKLLCKDLWTKITLPMLSTFLHTRFSALRVNNPKTKIGYFFGSFYIITRATYESIGTHKTVRQELIEDGAIGGMVKREKFSIKMVRGERYVEAVWAHDLTTLWHALRRLMIPLYNQNKIGTIMMIIAVIFLLLEPFLLLPFSIWFSSLQSITISQAYVTMNLSVLLSKILICLNVAIVVIILLSNAIQSKLGVLQNPLYTIACPISSAIISVSFIISIIDARKRGAISWRGRKYTIEERQHPLS